MMKGRKSKRTERGSSVQDVSRLQDEQSISAAESRQNMSMILSRMAELELSKDEDELYKDFLTECKQKSDLIPLTESEKESELRIFHSGLALEVMERDTTTAESETARALTIEERNQRIIQMFNEKLSMNANLRRRFMEDFSSWKSLLRERKDRLKDRCQMENDYSAQITVNKQLQTIYADVVKKANEVNNNTINLIQAELACNEELKAKFDKTLSDVIAKLQEHEEEMRAKSNDNDQLKSKLQELSDHFEMQKSHYEQQLHAKSLQMQFYNAKIAQKKEIEARQRSELDKYLAEVNSILGTNKDMQNQLAMCAEKTVEFQSSIDRSDEVYFKYAEQQQSVEGFAKKVEEETEAANQEIKELESILLNTVNKIQKSEEILNTVNKIVREKVSKCRTLQEERTVLQNRVAKKNQAMSDVDGDDMISSLPSDLMTVEAPIAKFPTSSSSSSSSTRMLREQITSTAGEESPAASSPPLNLSYLR